MPYHASIASAKAAVEGLTWSPAAEYAGSIRFNAIAPPLTDKPCRTTITYRQSERVLCYDASDEKDWIVRGYSVGSQIFAFR